MNNSAVSKYLVKSKKRTKILPDHGKIKSFKKKSERNAIEKPKMRKSKSDNCICGLQESRARIQSEWD